MAVIPSFKLIRSCVFFLSDYKGFQTAITQHAYSLGSRKLLVLKLMSDQYFDLKTVSMESNLYVNYFIYSK